MPEHALGTVPHALRGHFSLVLIVWLRVNITVELQPVSVPIKARYPNGPDRSGVTELENNPFPMV
jgi:hypothetical protein